MTDKGHKGQIVLAEIIETIDDSHYKLKTIIETGDLKGSEYYVIHKGNPDLLKKNIVIRLDQPPKKKSELNLDDITTIGYFITSSIPDKFEDSHSKDIIFYGIWSDSMKDVFYEAPIIGKISEYYNPGVMHFVLHYKKEGDSIIPYQIFYGKQPKIHKKGHGKPKSYTAALKNYLSYMDRKTHSNTPRVITIEEGIDLEGKILPEFRKMNMGHIQMEPQR